MRFRTLLNVAAASLTDLDELSSPYVGCKCYRTVNTMGEWPGCPESEFLIRQPHMETGERTARSMTSRGETTCEACRDERHRVCKNPKLLLNLHHYQKIGRLTDAETMICCD